MSGSSNDLQFGEMIRGYGKCEGVVCLNRDSIVGFFLQGPIMAISWIGSKRLESRQRPGMQVKSQRTAVAPSTLHFVSVVVAILGKVLG